MTDAVVTDLETAAIPTAIAALKAVQAFNTNMGTDPLQWVAKFPGALTILVGTLQLQVPSLLVSEGGAVIGEVNTKIDGFITTLQGKLPAPVAAAPLVPGATA